MTHARLEQTLVIQVFFQARQRKKGLEQTYCAHRIRSLSIAELDRRNLFQEDP